jgi:hypothetical protein
LPPLNVEHLLQRFDGPNTHAVVLMGSYARGDAGPFSDIDLVRFVAPSAHLPDAGSHLIDDHLVVVSNVVPNEVERWFAEPDAAVGTIGGVRSAQALIDRNAYFAAIQARAHAFVWDAAMQERANRWASAQMVGWIEEVGKGLEGLRRNDVGRMLNARHGCSWGLARVLLVQRGVLLAGDNAFYDALTQAVEPHSEWAQLRDHAFGVADTDGSVPALRDQVRAGLQLYVVTAELLSSALQPRDVPLIAHAVARIKQQFSNL